MLGTGGTEQHQFGQVAHLGRIGTQKYLADFFADGRATRFARDDHVEPALEQIRAQRVDERGLARAVAAVAYQHETPRAARLRQGVRNRCHCFLPRMYLATARLCSRKVLENWLLPTPRATK